MKEIIKGYLWECDVCEKSAETERDKFPPGWESWYGMHVCSEHCKKEATATRRNVYHIDRWEPLVLGEITIIDWYVTGGKLHLTVDYGMKVFADGDVWCFVRDDFVDLQESPAVFVPMDTEMGKRVSEKSFDGLTDGEAELILSVLKREGTKGNERP